MPRLKPKIEPWAKMTRLLRGYQLNPTTLASVLECSRPTATKRMQQPGTLTLDELYAISIRAHIPMEEIREAVSR